MVGLALEGGGAKGSYQVGAYLALKEKGINVDVIAGTSIGSINGALFAQGDELLAKEFWLKASSQTLMGIDDNLFTALKNKKITKSIIGQTFATVKTIMKNKGIDTTNIKKGLNECINEEKLRRSKIDYGLVTLRFKDLKPVEIFKNDIEKGKLQEYLLASSYLPVFKQEHIIDGNIYLDGGFYDACPINMLINKGCDKIYAIRIKGIGVQRKIIDNNVNIITIQPKGNLGGIIDFDHDKIENNMRLGYYDALKVLDNLDGYNYYFKNLKEKSYDKLIRTKGLAYNFVQKKFKTSNNKELIIKSIEYILKKENLKIYKIYRPLTTIERLKKVEKNDDMVYNFIRELKIKLFKWRF